MDKFKIAEELEHKMMIGFLNSKGISNIKFSGDYWRHDGEYINSKGDLIMFETKVRDVTSKYYPTTVIEKSKYDYLMGQKDPVYLFVFFTDNKVLVADVKKSDVKFTKRLSPKTTSGNKEKVLKHFVEFEIKDSTLIDYEQER